MKKNHVCFGGEGIQILEDRLGMKIRDLTVWYNFLDKYEKNDSNEDIYKKKWWSVEQHDIFSINCFDVECFSVDQDEKIVEEQELKEEKTVLENFFDENDEDRQFSPFYHMMDYLYNKFLRIP